MNEFELKITLNTDEENVGFLLIDQIGFNCGKSYVKEQKSYYTKKLDKQFITDSIADFVNEKLK